MELEAAIFDMDGTLTVPSIDFNEIRDELKIPVGNDIVDTIRSWDEYRQQGAWALIERHEDESEIILKKDVEKCLGRLRSTGLKLGLLTRNSSKNVSRFLLKSQLDFDLILTREHTHIKPDPETVRYFLSQWGVSPEKALVIGDYIDDLTCARDAGAKSCFFHNPEGRDFSSHADFTVRSFEELEKLLLS